MLVPFYWVLKTSLTGENIFAYPPASSPGSSPLLLRRRLVLRPLRPLPRNSVIVSLIVVAANVVLNAMAAYALTLEFRWKRAVILGLLSCMMIPFQATIVPAYLITKELGLLNSSARARAAALLHHRRHLRLQGGVRRGPPSLSTPPASTASPSGGCSTGSSCRSPPGRWRPT